VSGFIENTKIDSLKQMLQEKEINFSRVSLEACSILVFFGSCLSEEEAKEMQKQLSLRKIKTLVRKLEYIEQDL
jgi:hypothetical protein